MEVAESFPFSGALQLPTKMQALKLFWFIRDSIGHQNSCSLTNGQIQGELFYFSFSSDRIYQTLSAGQRRVIDNICNILSICLYSMYPCTQQSSPMPLLPAARYNKKGKKSVKVDRA